MRYLLLTVLTSMMFFPSRDYEVTPEQLGWNYEIVTLGGDENRPLLKNWFLKAEEQKGAVLLLHGNAGNISHRLFKAKGWLDQGYSVFLLDYRGYGLSEGKILHEQDVVEDAQLGLNWLLIEKGFQASQIILHGESLGSFPATKLATTANFKMLVLEAPFTSFDAMRKKYYPYIPAFVLKHFSFSNESLIESIRSPLFLMHGTEDNVVPFWMGENLFKKAIVPKKFYAVEGGLHSNLPQAAGADYWLEPIRFIESLST